MPGYRMHMVGGCAAWGSLIFLLPLFAMTTYHHWLVLVEWLIFALAGSLFPDVDTKSKGQNWLFNKIIPMLVVVCLVVRAYVYMGLVLLLRIIPTVAHHRGLFHRVWFVLAFPTVVAAILGYHFPLYRNIFLIDGLFFSAGAISHIWLDMGLKGLMRV